MKTLAQLDQLNLDADTKMQVTDLVQMLLEQSQKEVRSQQLKIQALAMELAYLSRIQFGKKSGSLLSKQFSLFEAKNTLRSMGFFPNITNDAGAGLFGNTLTTIKDDGFKAKRGGRGR